MEEFSVQLKGFAYAALYCKEFARVSSKVCTDEGSDCSRSTSMIAQLKNSSSVCAVLIQINRICDIAVSIFLIAMFRSSIRIRC